MSRVTVKFMDDTGKEVSPKRATEALVTHYDAEGRVVRETHGKLGGALDDMEVEEHGEK